MGSLCSKSGTHSGSHTLINPSEAATDIVAPSDPRAAAAAAAERRIKAEQARGTHASNPQRGQLAAKAGKPVKPTMEPRQEERLVWD